MKIDTKHQDLHGSAIAHIRGDDEQISLFQIATHKYEIIKPRKSLFFSHLRILLNLPQQHYAYIGNLSQLADPKPRWIRLLFYTQKENHSNSK